MKTYRGKGVSPGISMGHVLKADSGLPPSFKIRLSAEGAERELGVFEDALQETTAQLKRIHDVVDAHLGAEHSRMVEALILILHDVHFAGAIREHIRQECVNADWAVKVVADRVSSIYAGLEDPFFQEKAHDIRDLSSRLIRNIWGRAGSFDHEEFLNVIAVGTEVSFSMLSEKHFPHLKGLAADKGGWTSHTSIIARSLRIPSVIDLQNITSEVVTGQFVIIDGNEGLLIVDPDEETKRLYEDLVTREPKVTGPLYPLTRVGRKGLEGLHVFLNAEYPFSEGDSPDSGVEGVGLFRSEFLCMGKRPQDLTTQDHAAVYAELARRFRPLPVNIRTMDLDARRAGFGVDATAHPAMGLRGIRLSLRHPEFFVPQLKGILMAAGEGNLCVTFPFVTSAEEMAEAKEMFHDLARLMEVPPERVPRVGCMLEIPSNIFIIEDLARHADFFTLGTNDLVQFFLAMDRSEASPSFSPAHPAVRRALQQLRRETERCRREVICCGEMASHPFYLMSLLALGFRRLSVDQAYLPMIRFFEEQLKEAQLEAFLAALSELGSLREIEQLHLRRLPEFFSTRFARTVVQLFRVGI